RRSICLTRILGCVVLVLTAVENMCFSETISVCANCIGILTERELSTDDETVTASTSRLCNRRSVLKTEIASHVKWRRDLNALLQSHVAWLASSARVHHVPSRGYRIGCSIEINGYDGSDCAMNVRASQSGWIMNGGSRRNRPCCVQCGECPRE